MKIYNVLTRKKEEFTPIEKGKVKMYACGITVNGDAHIGHARQAIVFDMMVQYLKYIGYDVKYVRNYTDVDDRLLAQASEMGIDPMELSRKRIAETDKLIHEITECRDIIMTRVTEYIPQIVEFVKGLMAKGFAYKVDSGDIYFDVRRDPNYGKLSNRNIDELKDSVRVDNDENKHSPLDFALWKSASSGEFGWDTEIGRGRPGWHIECSTMIESVLGDMIDIHGGGKDLIFPHHENEIAQSECLHDKNLANYWVHNGLVTINGQKMSKSLGNFVLLKDVLSKYSPEVLRFAILSSHYASSMDLSDDFIRQSEKNMYYFYTTINKLAGLVDNSTNGADEEVIHAFREAMDNDFNTAEFIGYLFTKFAEVNALISKNKLSSVDATKFLNALHEISPVLGIFKSKAKEFIDSVRSKYLSSMNIDSAKVEKLVSQRLDAKRARDFATADAIRDELQSMGIILFDTPSGTTWDVGSLY